MFDKSAKKIRYVVPKEFLYKESRAQFKSPEVIKYQDVKIIFQKPKDEELIQFLVEEKQFSLENIEGKLKKMKSIKSKGFQRNLETFFGRPKIIKRSGKKK